MSTTATTATARHRLRTLLSRLRHEDCASQIVEFAVSLPLLIVFVVGIFDFSGAFTLKQKIAGAAREGARASAADPATDVATAAVPVSVSDAFQVVDNYLKSANVSDCGIAPPTGVGANPMTWTTTATAGACTLTINIDRGYIVNPAGTTATNNCLAQAPVAGTKVVATCVGIQYNYKWTFNSVVTLLVPGARYSGTSTLTTAAVVLNEN